MADYTKLNLKEDVEFRTARVPLETENAAISYLRVAPNFRLPFGHTHGEQEEVYVLIGGSARIKLDDEVLELRPFDAIRIHRDTMRNLEGGPNGAELILYGAPNAGPGDAQMSPGWWID
jgi:mannose-6-phosphate isomerase-like protein (cupin superfamily)